MMRKILWGVVSGLMALSLVIASCGPAETTPTTPTTPTTTTTPTTPTAPVTEKPQQEVVTPGVEKPQYGGELIQALGADLTSFYGLESC